MVSNRLRTLRQDAERSQSYIAKELGCTQSTINRYEHGDAEAPYKTLLWYADYFSVSLDYIFGRTNEKEEMEHRIAREKEARREKREWEMLIELCFTAGTEMHSKLKELLLGMQDDLRQANPVEAGVLSEKGIGDGSTL